MKTRSLIGRLTEDETFGDLLAQSPKSNPAPEPSEGDPGVGDESDTSMDLNELIEKWMEANNAYRMSERPQQFESLINDMSGGQYRDVADFVADNPGAVEAMLNWIMFEAKVPDWASNLKEALSSEPENMDDYRSSALGHPVR